MANTAIPSQAIIQPPQQQQPVQQAILLPNGQIIQAQTLQPQVCFIVVISYLSLEGLVVLKLDVIRYGKHSDAEPGYYTAPATSASSASYTTAEWADYTGTNLTTSGIEHC